MLEFLLDVSQEGVTGSWSTSIFRIIIYFQNIAMELFEYLKNEKNIMVNPVGGELGKSSIRVAHIGDLSCSDYDLLIDELRSFLKE